MAEFKLVATAEYRLDDVDWPKGSIRICRSPGERLNFIGHFPLVDLPEGEDPADEEGLVAVVEELNDGAAAQAAAAAKTAEETERRRVQVLEATLQARKERAEQAEAITKGAKGKPLEVKAEAEAAVAEAPAEVEVEAEVEEAAAGIKASVSVGGKMKKGKVL